MGKPLFDGFVRERADPQSLKGFGDAEILVDKAEYELTFPSCIGGNDNVLTFPKSFSMTLSWATAVASAL